MKTKILTIFCMILISLAFVQAVTIDSVSSSPTEVAPGEITNIILEIENIFEDRVYNLNVRLDLEDTPFAPYQSSSEKFLEELDDGDKEDFKFKLIALPETSSGIYKIPVKISYENEEGNVSLKDDLISLIVNSEPELKVSLEDSIVLIRGRENTFSIRMINSGLADVKFVYLIVSDVTGIKFLSEKEQYLGDIDSDDFDNAEYNIYLDADSPEDINLQIILKFKDATNKEFVESKNIILRTYSLQEAKELGLVKRENYIPYIIIGSLIVGYIVYRILKKRKLKKKRES
jgi:hypothetical protein